MGKQQDFREEILSIEKKLKEYRWALEIIPDLEEPIRSNVLRILLQRLNETTERLAGISVLIK